MAKKDQANQEYQAQTNAEGQDVEFAEGTGEVTYFAEDTNPDQPYPAPDARRPADGGSLASDVEFADENANGMTGVESDSNGLAKTPSNNLESFRDMSQPDQTNQ